MVLTSEERSVLVEFIEFCKMKANDDNPTINHNSGWEQCSVGQFAKGCGYDVKNLVEVDSCAPPAAEKYPLQKALRKVMVTHKGVIDGSSLYNIFHHVPEAELFLSRYDYLVMFVENHTNYNELIKKTFTI